MSGATFLPQAKARPRVGPPSRPTSSHRLDFVRSVFFSAARGAALIGIAVIIGIALLNVVDDGNKGPIGNGGSSGKGTVASTTTSRAKSSSTTKPQGAPRPPQQVQVLVLNGSNTNGAARNLTSTLKAKGYQTLPATDAPSKRRGTVVYFTGGFEREAATVAQAVGGNPPVQALPDPPPAGTDGANVVVIIGT